MPLISFTLNHTIIHPTSTARYLEVLLDDKLKFDTHLTFLESKLYRSVGIISRLSQYLPTKTLLALYYSLVHTHLLHALPIWASTYDTYLIEIQRLQNKAIRILTKCRVSDRITSRFHDLRILKVNDMFKYEIGKLMYQYTHKKLPEHFNNYFTYMSKAHSYSTRNNVTNQIALPRFSTSRSQKSFKFIGAKLWNKISYSIKQLSYPEFKTEYKNILLSKYIDEENHPS